MAIEAIIERKRLIYTAIVVGLVGIATGLFLVGHLVPFPPEALQHYAETAAATKTESSMVGAVGEYSETIVVFATETTPHGTVHNFVAALVPNVALVPTSSTQVRGANEVWAFPSTFEPGILTVPVGTTVVWTTKGGMEHTMTSETGLFDGTVVGSISFNYTFTKPGNYEYNCVIHSGMSGAIHVQ